MTSKPVWVGPQRPTNAEFESLCMTAAEACARGARVFNIDENGDFYGPQRLMIEDLIHSIEQVIDAAQDLNRAVTACLADALPVERVVDVEVVEAGPF